MLAAAAAAACAALAGPAPASVTIVRATMVTPTPVWTPITASFYKPEPVRVPLCRVEGTIEGNIGFELWLPAEWNGRLLGAGVGGDAGVFNYSDMSRRIAQGFATVTTDSGHKTTQLRWMADPKARVDYEHRATHLTAQAAKSLARAFYGRGVDKSYYLGCSGGGRQALKEMQNYPGDYDGVVAGAPGPYMPLQSVRMMWGALLQKNDPAGALGDSDWALYERRATAACDKIDGVADGIVENPLRCTFKPRDLACKPGQSADCLSGPKLAMLQTIVQPMPDERGRAMDWGLYPGVRTRPGPPSPLLRAMWADGVYNDPKWNEDGFRRTADLAAANRLMPELRADKTAIAPFVRAGGKAILYQGWADPSTNAGPTLHYYGALARAQGGIAKLDDSVRLFMVPGMYHCRGGPGVDAFGGSGQAGESLDPERDVLWALIGWVEQGRIPQRLIAAKRDGGTVRFTRMLCPFPQSAQYDGRGLAGQATSSSCKTDPALVRLISAK
ncbi:tannase/feruloyl esterase family alpha/beta hydrolase [Sphingomonas sp. PB4P5]|uniref:tannase/feruloyl esterase family alpha/beta hydrolase n=1 Tax=Parasphingomonas puruogangriensis TaxID=3096155 RepID=UPI002FC6D6BF